MYLITSQYLFDNTRIKANTTWDVLQPYFKDVQDMSVKDLLGIPLFELYLNFIENGSELSPAQAELFLDIQKYFAKRVEYDYALLSNVNLNNKGATTDAAGDIKLINEVRNVISAQFTNYEERIKAYLTKNMAEFPEYFGNPDDIQEPPVPRNTSALGFLAKPLLKRRYY